MRVILVILVALSLIGETTNSFAMGSSPKPPPWNAKIYQGWPQTGSVIRSQEKESISCSAPKFKKFVCVTGEELVKLRKLFLSCRKWKK